MHTCKLLHSNNNEKRGMFHLKFMFENQFQELKVDFCCVIGV